MECKAQKEKQMSGDFYLLTGLVHCALSLENIVTVLLDWICATE